MNKAFVLLSGGLDSTSALYKAIYDYCPKIMSQGYGDPELIRQGLLDPNVEKDIPWVEAVSVDYGQRHQKEMEYAERTCKRLGITHTTLHLGDILAGSMLTDPSIKIPDIKYDEISGVSPTYVPFRNGLLLSLITAHAQKWVNANKDMDRKARELEQIDDTPWQAGIYFGAHSEDAHNWAYPDCTPEFIGAMANAIFIGSYQAIRLITPWQWNTKAEIVRAGSLLGVDFAGTWSCYAGGEHHCGKCPTCYARQQAFRDADVPDPTEYT